MLREVSSDCLLDVVVILECGLARSAAELLKLTHQPPSEWGKREKQRCPPSTTSSAAPAPAPSSDQVR